MMNYCAGKVVGVNEWRRINERRAELTNARPYTTGSVTSSLGQGLAASRP